MKLYLRFTDTANADLIRGTSLLNIPSLSSPIVLKGLCGYTFCDIEEIEYNIFSDEEIENKVEMYINNLDYTSTPVLFKGEYIEQNQNSEGVIFKPIEIYKVF